MLEEIWEQILPYIVGGLGGLISLLVLTATEWVRRQARKAGIEIGMIDKAELDRVIERFLTGVIDRNLSAEEVAHLGVEYLRQTIPDLISRTRATDDALFSRMLVQIGSRLVTRKAGG